MHKNKRLFQTKLPLGLQVVQFHDQNNAPLPKQNVGSQFTIIRQQRKLGNKVSTPGNTRNGYWLSNPASERQSHLDLLLEEI